MRSVGTYRAFTIPDSLTDDVLLLPSQKYEVVSGPRGTRTLDLLNAIETRSQLRHGPLFGCQWSVNRNQWVADNKLNTIH